MSSLSQNKLTSAQTREYELLQTHGSIGIWGRQRMNVLDQLVIKGLAEKDGSYNWFHLKRK